MVQSNPDSIGKRRGWGRREKTSLVREKYEMEREEKYIKKKPELKSVVVVAR